MSVPKIPVTAAPIVRASGPYIGVLYRQKSRYMGSTYHWDMGNLYGIYTYIYTHISPIWVCQPSLPSPWKFWHLGTPIDYRSGDPHLAEKKHRKKHEFFPKNLASGELTKSNWKWPFIVDFPIKNGWSFHCYVNVHQRVNPKKHPISMARVSPRPFGGLHLWSPPGFPKRPQSIWGKFRKMMACLSIDLGFGWIWDDLGLLHLETKNRQR